MKTRNIGWELKEWTTPRGTQFIDYSVDCGGLRLLIRKSADGGLYEVGVLGRNSRWLKRKFEDFDIARKEAFKFARKIVKEQMKMLDIMDDM